MSGFPVTTRGPQTAADWTTLNPVLAQFELGIEVDPATGAYGLAKLGNGRDRWNDLPYFPPVSPLNGYVAADVTYNNTAALAAVPGMSVTVATGGIYAVNLVVQSTSAVKALLMDFAGTVTDANFIGEWMAGFADDLSSGPIGNKVTAMSTAFAPTDIDGTDGYYSFIGTFEVTTGGTFGLRGAQRAADVSDTKILRGSYMTVAKLNT